MVFDTHEWSEIAGILAVAGAALVALWKGIRCIYQMARKVEAIFEHAQVESVEREKLAKDLRAHVQMEEDRDSIRDRQFINIVNDLNEITREIRPNGGSSLKDDVTATRRDVGEIKTRVAVLEEWKRAETADRGYN